MQTSSPFTHRLCVRLSLEQVTKLKAIQAAMGPLVRLSDALRFAIATADPERLVAAAGALTR